MSSTPAPETAEAALEDGCPVAGHGRLDYPFPHPTALTPPDEWARLRRECPVAPIRATTGADGFLLTRYDDVKSMLADPRFLRGSLTGQAGGVGDVGSDEGFGSNMDLFTGEDHVRWRRILGRAFTVRRMRAMEPDIARIAHELIDDMTVAGAPADLKAALGFPLPVFVICDLLGVPVEDRVRFSGWSDRLLAMTAGSHDDSLQAGAELFGYMSELVEAKRADPGDDLLSELATAPDEANRLSTNDLISTGIALLVAGHETTANMIGKMVAMLLVDRRRWEQLLADESLVRTAVEECLRFDANLGFAMPRRVDRDIEVAGTAVPAGSTVWSAMASANRDESVFADAAEMDLTRSPNVHLTFGVGAHSCLGQSLARFELQTVLRVLLERLPTLELAVDEFDLRRREGLFVGGLERVPVRW